jgi:hypothetical protein
MMRTNTKKFKVLKFLSSRAGTRYMDIERFICEMNGHNYDQKILRGFYAGKRRHSGIWSTNLTCGRDSILKKYCYKSNKLWYVNKETEKFINSNLPLADKVLKAIEIKEAKVTHSVLITPSTGWQDKVVSHGPIMSLPKEDEEDWGSVDLAAKINASAGIFSQHEILIVKDIQFLNKMRNMLMILSTQRANILKQITKLNEEILIAEKSLSVKLGLSK